MMRQHDYGVRVYANSELLIATWNDGLGSLAAEIAATKSRIDNPADPATHMAVDNHTGRPLPNLPWADVTGYTTPRKGKPSPREAFLARIGNAARRRLTRLDPP